MLGPETLVHANSVGVSKKYRVGDKVTFFIPPTAAQAKVAGRKPKHLPNFRGPASIVEVLSDTTYKLEYRGRSYKRSAAELRPYKAKTPPLQLPTANDPNLYLDNLILNNFVALRDTDHPDDKHFSVAKVLEVDEDTNQVTLQYFGTKTGNIKQAKWFKLLKWERRDSTRTNTMKHTYKLGGASNTKYKPVKCVIDKDDPERDFSRVVHCNLQMLPSARLSKKSITQLAEMGYEHHQLNKTFS